MEQWKEIIDSKGYYQISSFGRIKSISRYVNYRGNRKRKVNDKFLKPKQDKDNYLRAGLYIHNKQKYYLIHRLVALYFIPNPENLPEVLHLDNNTTNNSVDNLKWGTRQDNIDQCVREKRHPHGETHGCSKLTEEKVLEIRKKANILSKRKIAKELNISLTLVSRIVNKLNWKHI